MTGVRISTMRVNAFRGISSETLFDFTSPLTLVFAPNGTGKTTMCEAAEWLLTGQVDRLRDKGRFEQKVLCSKFAPSSRPPLVDAEIHLGNDALRLQRIVKGSESQARIAGANSALGAVIGLNDLLARLAPAAAAADAHPLRAISLRQGWLRGTRFLSAEALATLVDSDDGTIERRKDVFADLLGIRHLLEAEKLVDRYVADVSSRERVLLQTLAGREDEIARLTAELQRAPLAITSTASELVAAEQRLGLSADYTGDLQETLAARIEALDVQQHRRRHLFDTRREAIEASAAQWPQRAALQKQIDALDAAHPTLVAKVGAIVEQGQAAGLSIASATTRCDTLKEQLRALDAAKASLRPLCARLLNAVSGQLLPSGLSSASTLAQLVERLPQARQTNEAIAVLQGEARAALEGERAAADTDLRGELLRQQLDSALKEQLSEGALADLRSEADRLEKEAQRAKQQLEATASPLERLQAAGRELINHRHEGGPSSCPLCSHDWGSAHRLRGAMAATLAAVSELEKFAQQRVAASSEASQRASARLQDAQRSLAHVTRLRAELGSLEREADARRGRLARLGITGADRITALEALERGLAAAAALSQLLRARDQLSTTLPANSIVLLGDATPLGDLGMQVEQAIGARQKLVRQELEVAENELTHHTARRDVLRNEHALAAEALRANREAQTRLRGELEKLRQLWNRAAPEIEWNQQGLASVRDWAAREQSLLDDVAARTAAAKAAWNAEVRRARLDALQREAAPLRERLNYLGERLASARHAGTCFHESYVQVSARQIEDLGRVVNPLFARMHANRVFDKIKLGQVDDPLRWLADAGNQELDPGKDFSQGQRQDLALALFLARARSLGGTFFLDEPVTHLDDLNRVGLLDIFRATVLESSASLNLVITTASKPLARHLIEKFARVGPVETPIGRVRPLRVIELDGNGRTGTSLRPIYPADA